MDAPKLRASHTSSGCFDLTSTGSDSHATGHMQPFLVEGSEPAQVHYRGTVRYGKRVDPETTEERRTETTAQNHHDLLDKLQRVVNAYYAD